MCGRTIRLAFGFALILSLLSACIASAAAVPFAYVMLQTGDTVAYGHIEGYEDFPLQWFVLSVTDTDIFLLACSSMIGGEFPFFYAESTQPQSDRIARLWENSTIRYWLNTDEEVSLTSDMKRPGFKKCFSEAEWNALVPQPFPGAFEPLNDRVFLLSAEEVQNPEYADIISNKYPTFWWLRSNAGSEASYARQVDMIFEGKLDQDTKPRGNYSIYTAEIRPAVKIDRAKLDQQMFRKGLLVPLAGIYAYMLKDENEEGPDLTQIDASNVDDPSASKFSDIRLQVGVGLNKGPANLASNYYYSRSKRDNEGGYSESGLNKLPFRYYFDSGMINCTFYCYGRAMEKTGVELLGINGNGKDWLGKAIENGYSTGSVIQPNSIAVIEKTSPADTYGHVVFIEDAKYDSDTGNPTVVSFSQGNWGKPENDGVIITKSYDDFINYFYSQPIGYIYTDHFPKEAP